MYGGEPGRREITDNHVLACDVSDASLNFRARMATLLKRPRSRETETGCFRPRSPETGKIKM